LPRSVSGHADREIVVREIHQAGESGLSVARNVGFRAGHGEFTCFLDAGDTVLPDMIEKQLEISWREPDADLAISPAFTS
jgi:glycosyltransferase involved in cell wall biosynthesis